MEFPPKAQYGTERGEIRAPMLESGAAARCLEASAMLAVPKSALMEVLILLFTSWPAVSQPTAARIRMDPNPKQIAGAGGSEGQSLNFTRGENAAAMWVEKTD